MHWAEPCISNLAKRRVRSSAQVKEAPDDGTCTTGCEPRVQVCNCQERESDQVYKSSQWTFWGTHVQITLFTLASPRAYCEREHCTVPWDFLSVLALSIWWYCHWLGRWSAIGRSGAALFFCRFLRWISKKNGSLKRCTRRSFDEVVSSVLVNRQDQTLTLLGLGVFRGYLLMLDSNVLYTPHAFSCWVDLSYIRISTHTTLGAHYLDQTTEPTCSTQVLRSDVWSSTVTKITYQISLYKSTLKI